MDCADRDRIDEARQELHRIINDREMRDAIILIFANKQDLQDGEFLSNLFASSKTLFIDNHTYVYSHETTRNSRKTGSDAHSRSELVRPASMCHNGRRFVRRANVVNIQSQVIMNHSCGVLCITKFKKVVGRRGKKLGTISETI